MKNSDLVAEEEVTTSQPVEEVLLHCLSLMELQEPKLIALVQSLAIKVSSLQMEVTELREKVKVTRTHYSSFFLKYETIRSLISQHTATLEARVIRLEQQIGTLTQKTYTRITCKVSESN